MPIALLRGARHSAQPKWVPPVDGAHPILSAMGAEVLTLPHLGVRDLLRGDWPTVTGTLASNRATIGQAGSAQSQGFGAVASGQLRWSGRTSASGAGNTFAGILIRRALPSDANKFAYYFIFSGTVNVGLNATTTYTDGGKFSLFYAANALGSAVTITQDVPYFVICSSEAKGANSAWYIKIKNLQTGDLVSNQSGSASTSAGGAATWNISGSGVFGSALPADIFMAAMGSKYLPPALADQWLADPWQVFAPDDDSIIIPSSGGAYTLTSAAGSFTETGQDAGLLAARTLAMGAGGFTEIGQDAGLLAGRVIAAGAASFADTGQDAGLLATRILTSGAGAFALTGQDAGLLYGAPGAYTLTAAAASFVDTGQDAALLATRLLTAGVGSVDLTGVAAGLSATRLLTGGAGAIVLTGQSATLAYSGSSGYTLSASAGAYVLTGQDATLGVVVYARGRPSAGRAFGLRTITESRPVARDATDNRPAASERARPTQRK